MPHYISLKIAFTIRHQIVTSQGFLLFLKLVAMKEDQEDLSQYVFTKKRLFFYYKKAAA